MAFPTLRVLLAPAIWMMNRLRYGPKLVALGLLLLAPLGAVFYLQYRTASEQIDFNRGEQLGLDYISAAAGLLLAVEEYRAHWATRLAPDSFDEKALEASRQRVDAELLELRAVDANFSPDVRARLRSTPALKAIDEQWETLRNASDGLSNSDGLLNELAEKIRQELILRQVASNSNLILDPDIDSYWLAETYASRLPAIAHSFGESYVESLLWAQGKNQDHATELAGLARSTLLTLREMESINLKLAYEYSHSRTGNHGLQDKVAPHFQALLRRAEQQVRFLDERILSPGTFKALEPSAIQHGLHATLGSLESTGALFEAIRPPLSEIIQHRVAHFERQRSFGIFFSGLASILVAYFFGGFYFSARGSIQALDRATRKMVAGTTETFHLNSRDELGQLADQYNQLNSVLRQARALLENSPDGVCVVQNGLIVYANHSLVSLFGCWNKEQILGKSLSDFVDPTMRGDIQRLIARHYIRQDGMQIETEEAWDSILFEGAPAQLAIIRDVTERRRTDQALADQQIRNARAAGRAEIATAVLHNVGNVLNSVSVSVDISIEGLRLSKSPGLAKAVALIRSHQADLGSFFTKHPQGQQLPQYLGLLSEQLERERETMSSELELLRKNIEHVASIVRTQQSFAKSAGVVEQVAPADVFREALSLSMPAAHNRMGIEVHTDFEFIPSLSLEKHKVIQVLVNLITNAVDAVSEQDGNQRRLTLKVERPASDRIAFSVSDNGIGISPENQILVFTHGFTTKKDGHGFGLHASACYAAEMNGSLTCHSEGPGRGSTFTLELPCKPLEMS